MLLELIVVLFLIYFFIVYYENYGNSMAPPGPFKIPPFGNLIQLALGGSTGYLGLDNMAKKYGDVMSIKLGFMDSVVLSSYEAVKQVLAKEESYGRFISGAIADRNMHKNIGLILSFGESYQKMRTFCREALRKHGYGNREAMKNLMVDELAELMKHMEQEASSNRQGLVKFASDYFNKSFLNVMLELVIGQRLDYQDKQLLMLLENEKQLIKNGLLGTGIVTAYPFLRHVFPETLGHDVQMKGIEGYRQSAAQILTNKRNGEYKKFPKCFTDEFLKKIDEDKSKPEPFYTEEQFALVLSDILMAGTDTTSNVVNFTILNLTCSQDVQEKLYQEICQEIGTDRLPEIADKFRMPYTQAVLLEGLRHSRVIVLGVPREALSDFNYKNFKIKKGTALLTNVHCILFDEDFWGDPNIFRPERFFDKDGNLDETKTERIILFGAGKRSCFGEALARDSLFIFVTSLIQKFHFKSPVGVKPNLEPVMGITLSPHPYEAIVAVRK